MLIFLSCNLTFCLICFLVSFYLNLYTIHSTLLEFGNHLGLSILGDRGLELSGRSDIWQVHQHWRDAGLLREWYDEFNTQLGGFETSSDLSSLNWSSHILIRDQIDLHAIISIVTIIIMVVLLLSLFLYSDSG